LKVMLFLKISELADASSVVWVVMGMKKSTT